MEAKISAENGESSENRRVLGFVGEVAEEDDVTLKRMISSHPLFGLLIETHLNRLKVASGEPKEVLGTTHAANFKPDATIPSSSKLDLFLEAYCIALGKLKEALEVQQLETASFINDMCRQLREISETQPKKNTKSNSQTQKQFTRK